MMALKYPHSLKKVTPKRAVVGDLPSTFRTITYKLNVREQKIVRPVKFFTVEIIGFVRATMHIITSIPGL